MATGSAGGLVGEAERAVIVRRVVDAGAGARSGARVSRVSPTPSDGALAELDGALLDADDLDEPSPRSSAPTAPSSTGSPRGIAACFAAAASSA